MAITNRLTELRNRAGKTQGQVIEELTSMAGGVRPFTRQMLSHYETGRYQPSGEELAALCRYYGVQPGDILVLAGEGQVVSTAA